MSLGGSVSKTQKETLYQQRGILLGWLGVDWLENVRGRMRTKELMRRIIRSRRDFVLIKTSYYAILNNESCFIKASSYGFNRTIEAETIGYKGRSTKKIITPLMPGEIGMIFGKRIIIE